MILKRNKKGVAYFAIMLFVLVLVSMIILTIAFLNNLDFFKDNRIGERQAKIIGVSIRGEKSLFYLDKSAKTSAYTALSDLSERGGFKDVSSCGKRHDVNQWTCNKQSSFPQNPEDEFVSLFKPYLSKELSNYQEEFFPRSNYLVYVKNDGKIVGKSQLPMSIQKNQIKMPKLVDIDASQERIDTSWDPVSVGNQITDLAKFYAKEYKGYPYVWGGVSPYPYEVTLNDQKNNPSTFFSGVYLHEIVPPGNRMSGQPIVPGFDCSGFVWWTLHHLNLVSGRLTAQGYYEWSQNNGRMVCDDSKGSPCSEDLIRNHAKNGDLLFINKNKKTDRFGHIGIYEEDWRLIDSSGSRGVESRDIPNSYRPGGSLAIEAVYRLDYAKLKNTIPAPIISGNSLVQQAQSVQAAYVYDPSPDQDDELIYSFIPSFNIDIGYNFSNYNRLRDQSNILIDLVKDCETKGNNLDFCIDDSMMQQFARHGWSNDCYNYSEELVFGVIDSFDSCFNSNDDACFCDVMIPIKDKFADKNHELTFVDTYTHELNRLIASGQQGTIPSIPENIFVEFGTNDNGVREQLRDYEYQFAEGLMSNRKKLSGDIVLDVEYSDLPTVSIDSLEMIYNGDDYDLKDSILIFKEGNKVVFLADIDSSELQTLGYSECKKKPVRTRNFCVRDPKMKVFDYDLEHRKYVLNDLEYRFGLYFPEVQKVQQSPMTSFRNP